MVLDGLGSDIGPEHIAIGLRCEVPTVRTPGMEVSSTVLVDVKSPEVPSLGLLGIRLD